MNPGRWERGIGSGELGEWARSQLVAEVLAKHVTVQWTLVCNTFHLPPSTCTNLAIDEKWHIRLACTTTVRQTAREQVEMLLSSDVVLPSRPDISSKQTDSHLSLY